MRTGAVRAQRTTLLSGRTTDSGMPGGRSAGQVVRGLAVGV